MPRQLYLDSRDLIEIVARDLPLPAAKFAEVLKARNWVLVYSYSNVCETMIPDEVNESARRSRLLQSIPHSYIRAMPVIHCLEVEEALRAFDGNRSPRWIDPFVTHWCETFLYPCQDRSMSRLARLTFEQQVVAMVEMNPNVCRNLPTQTAVVQKAVDQDRTVTDAVRRNRKRFEGGLATITANCGLRLPPEARNGFARWVREDPARLPSWRLFDEGYLKFAANVTDTVDHGDANDWSHVSTLPYVDAITLDRRVAGYVGTAVTNLTAVSKECYTEKLFPNAAAWLRHIDADVTP